MPIEFVVDNRGSGPATATDVKLFSRSTPVATHAVPPLAPGASFSGVFRWTIAGLQAGVSLLTLRVDADQVVLESEEMNNFVSIRIQVLAAGLTIMPNRAPDAFVSVPYSTLIVAPPASNPDFRIISGSLPSGFILHRNGRLEGVSSVLGDHCFVLRATANGFDPGDGEVCVRVVEAQPAPLRIETIRLTEGCVDQEYRHEFIATGGVPPYAWQLDADAPDGMRLDGAGTFFGIPPRAGRFPLLLSVRDAVGSRLQNIYDFRVRECRDFALTVPSQIGLVIDEPATIELTAIGGTPPLTWAVVAGDAPPGMRLTDETIVGRPTALGTFAVGLAARDSTGAVASKSVQITVVGGEPERMDAGVPLDSGAGAGGPGTPDSGAGTGSAGEGQKPPGLETVESRGCACGTSDFNKGERAASARRGAEPLWALFVLVGLAWRRRSRGAKS